MKIQDRYAAGMPASVGRAARGPASAEAAPSQPAAAPADQFQVSGRSREIQRARASAFGAPEVRQERVDELAGVVGRGEYAVTGAQVAPKMIQEHLADAGR
ncbi:MAG: flagellar biosynthesis anti-sigma factor FlgM [Deltaproteobacteria bacterium]|nr:flagellar biosynthesis anti-sigma factor FlgM [Deltaproteobacteria bacterium]